MITEVEVQNYKSLETLHLPLARINVFIGENGSGKSNILEAIALGAAASSNKLDNEFLYSRGIRVPQNPIFMRAAFDLGNLSKEVSLAFKASDGTRYDASLSNENKPYSKWTDNKAQDLVLASLHKLIMSGEISPIYPMDDDKWELVRRKVQESTVHSYLNEFLIYSPENSFLRTSKSEGQIQPLGLRGEGLFRYLSYLSLEENAVKVEDIKCRMRLLEWFRDFAITEELPEREGRIDIRDRYIPHEVGVFDQLSTNEGFLIILFYFCLLVGAETPRFFAIDNIDTSLNPKLCTRLTKEIVDLAKKYEKQVILTTHNPAILDGLNLDDEEQRLFVVRRNKVGQTTIKRVMKPKVEEGVEPVRLSEAFLRGYIGGLPRNF
ncbi:MAG: putative ATPase [Chthonomonadales bacterium]|nr:putative ATPase [Chthonomonadales bacterium]